MKSIQRNSTLELFRTFQLWGKCLSGDEAGWLCGNHQNDPTHISEEPSAKKNKTPNTLNKLALINQVHEWHCLGAIPATRWPLTPLTSPCNLRLIYGRLDSSPDRGYKGQLSSLAGKGMNFFSELISCTDECVTTFFLSVSFWADYYYNNGS